MGWPVAHSRSPALHGFWLARAWHRRRLCALRGAAGESLARRSRRCRSWASPAATSPSRTRRRRSPVVDEIDRRPRAHRRRQHRRGRPRRQAHRAQHRRLRLPRKSAARACPDGGRAAGPAVVLGAGGAARAMVAALLDAGAARDPARQSHRRRARRRWRRRSAATVRGIAWEDRAAALGGCRTPGQRHDPRHGGAAAAGLPLDALPPTAAVYDIVYAPLETPLLAAARARGHPAVDGLGMLLHQARPGFAAWFGVSPR